MQNSHTRLKTSGTIECIPKGKRLTTPLVVNPEVPSVKLPVTQSSLHQGGFSQKTRLDAMLENLENCSRYLALQETITKEMFNTLGLILKESRLGTISTPSFRLYMDVISGCMAKDYNGYPLFDFGQSNPLRIHLIHEGVRFDYTVSPLPLRQSPAIQAFLCSSGSELSCSQGILDECGVELMQALVTISDNNCALVDVIKKITSRTLSYPSNKESRENKESNSTLSTSIKFISSLLKKITAKLIIKNRNCMPIPAIGLEQDFNNLNGRHPITNVTNNNLAGMPQN